MSLNPNTIKSTRKCIVVASSIILVISQNLVVDIHKNDIGEVIEFVNRCPYFFWIMKGLSLILSIIISLTTGYMYL